LWPWGEGFNKGITKPKKRSKKDEENMIKKKGSGWKWIKPGTRKLTYKSACKKNRQPAFFLSNISKNGYIVHENIVLIK
jgi:hypothetical protein